MRATGRRCGDGSVRCWHGANRLEIDDERDLGREELRDVWFNLGDVRYVAEDVEDPHRLGRVDGRPVIVDYGRGDFIRRGDDFHLIESAGHDSTRDG